MSDRKKIFDAMREMRDAAWRSGRTPRRWEINGAGLDELMMDERLTGRDINAGLVGQPFLGAPIAMMPTPGNGPMVELIVDELPPQR
jgi:hypothetical protein